MSDFDKEAVIRRIRGLMEKTVANGCSEAEAMLAASKVGDMLNQYQLSLSDVKLREEICERLEIMQSSKDGGPMFWVLRGIGYFTDTKVWRTSRANQLGHAKFNFFGFKTDVVVAGYLFDICHRAMIYSWEDYRRSIPDYTRLDSSQKNRLKNGFFIGMANRLDKRLHEMKDAQRKQNISNGRDLVPVKSAKVMEEWEALGIELKTSKVGALKMDAAAWAAGVDAADRVGLNQGVGQDRTQKIGG